MIIQNSTDSKHSKNLKASLGGERSRVNKAEMLYCAVHEIFQRALVFVFVLNFWFSNRENFQLWNSADFFHEWARRITKESNIECCQLRKLLQEFCSSEFVKRAISCELFEFEALQSIPCKFSCMTQLLETFLCGQKVVHKLVLWQLSLQTLSDDQFIIAQLRIRWKMNTGWLYFSRKA